MADQSYIYDAGWDQERTRLANLEAENDPYTRMHLEQLGIEPGWTCLEVGAGGGSMVAWLCERVAPGGRVVATDIDTRFVEKIDAPNLEIRRHDITAEDLEADAFDLVHSRFLLEHLPDREAVLDKLVSAVKPGGWLMVEDVDFADMSRPDGLFSTGLASQARFFAGISGFMASRGVDPNYGSKLPAALLQRGLTDTGGASRRVLMRGGDRMSTMSRLSTLALREPMVAGGFVSDEDIEAVLRMLEDPDAVMISPSTFAAWGRKA